MTLSMVERYDEERTTRIDGRAVVVGASMAGLLAARVLADRYATVTVLDRDSLPDEPVARRGVPQGTQPHALLEAGRAILEDFFPGYGEDLEAAGGLVLDGSTDFRLYSEGGFFAATPTPTPFYSASRPLFEAVARKRLATVDGVELRAPYQFVEYGTDAETNAVTGVLVRDEDGDVTEIAADLVVDATGRTSRTPAWLERHGYAPPALEEVRVDVAYSSVLVERPPDEEWSLLAPPSYPRARSGAVFPVEDGRWIVNLAGMHGDHPPTDADDLASFAASLPTPEIREILESQSPVSGEVHQYRYPSSRRYRYDELRRFPDGLVVIGDAIASFNPIHGQGMSAAALESLVLHHVLAEGRADVGPRFFERVADVIENVWLLAVGADFAFPRTEGTKPRGTDLFGRYVSRLTRRAHTDGWLTERFFRVVFLEQPSTTLLHPRVMWRVFRPRLASRAGPGNEFDVRPAE